MLCVRAPAPTWFFHLIRAYLRFGVITPAEIIEKMTLFAGLSPVRPDNGTGGLPAKAREGRLRCLLINH